MSSLAQTKLEICSLWTLKLFLEVAQTIPPGSGLSSHSQTSSPNENQVAPLHVRITCENQSENEFQILTCMRTGSFFYYYFFLEILTGSFIAPLFGSLGRLGFLNRRCRLKRQSCYLGLVLR